VKKVIAGFVKTVSAAIGKTRMEKLLIYSAKVLNINLHEHGLVQIGAYISHIPEKNGESFFVQNILPRLIESGFHPIFFDVGANVGNYALGLRNRFPDANIYTFEPVRSTYDLLNNNVSGCRIDTYNLGLGDKKGRATIFNKANNNNTELATLYSDVFKAGGKSEGEITSSQCEIDTIDNFCDTTQVKNIHFLKIDVEGHELSVLKGASEMLKRKRIDIIQFEFNSHNIYSRVYLRDFFLSLNDFEIFRILPNGLLRLGAYNSANEIFLLQNLLAVRKDICHLLDKSYLYSPY